MPVRAEDADRFAPERAYLVGVDWGKAAALTAEESLTELENLVRAAGAEVVGGVIQRRTKPDAALLVGSGKAREIAAEAREAEANLVAFDEPLTPAQQRNLEEKLDVRVVDRPTVILDIFAQRARTNEGRLQVELAQLEYELPRLRGWGGELSRTAGGIGTRGPGETKLEIDRRRVMKRIATLKGKIKDISRRRSLERAGRATLPLVAIVGYTNSGKTTLLNRLAGAEAYAADVPFATLDPFVKRARLPSGRAALLADTVGLISNLPADLVAAFRATMEEIRLADTIIVVRDVTAANLEARAKVVEELLAELGAREKPRVDAFNKVDLAPGFDVGRFGELGFERPLAISAATGEGCERLLELLDELLAQEGVRVVAELVPGPLLAEVYERGRVRARDYRDGRVRVVADVPAELARRLEAYVAADEGV
ncbi:MAG: GTPase HflX [candidate division Zixibacteria bacterium]|nr:GTPase HflX [candidate division Zixibacteria bacterium]